MVFAEAELSGVPIQTDCLKCQQKHGKCDGKVGFISLKFSYSGNLVLLVKSCSQ